MSDEPRSPWPGERVRLFVALELPDQVRDALIAWRRQALGASRRLRLIAPEHLHVTLCFLGWQDRDDVARIGDACRAATAADAVTPLALAEAIWLPPRRPRVLAVQLVDSGGWIGREQASLSEALQARGWYQPEKRPFLPHVTVARVPAGVRLRPRPLPAPPALGFDPAGLTLYRSHLARAGAQYEPLRRIPVGRAAG